jgi:hypothetical protein
MIRLFRVLVPTTVVALLVSETILISTRYVVATFLMMDVAPEVFLLDDNGWLRIALVAACLILGIYFQDLYTQFRIRSMVLLFQQMFVVVGVTFLAQALLVYLRLQDLILPTLADDTATVVSFLHVQILCCHALGHPASALRCK